MDFTAARAKMVDNQIRPTDVTSHSVLRAFLDVPRENFVADHLKAIAYIDSDLEIAPGRYIMQPSPLAKLIQLAEIDKGCSVLEIGAGTGYVSALLADVAGKVTALESDTALAEKAKVNLSGLGNVELVSGALAAGWPKNGPYDVIVVNGGVDTLPEALFAQLKEGGRLVAVVGRGQSSSARVYVRENRTQSERFAFNASVKPLPGFEAKPEFAF